MNVIKEYNTAKKQKGNVTFGAAHGARWNFRISDKESGAWTKIMRVPGGKEIAERIAEVISKSWKRTAGKKMDSAARLDARARRQIDHLTGLQTLADWKGEPEWWSNDCTAESAVNMIYVNRPPEQVPAGIGPEDLAPVVAQEPIGEAITA
jgi:hypothetical protein